MGYHLTIGFQDGRVVFECYEDYDNTAKRLLVLLLDKYIVFVEIAIT